MLEIIVPLVFFGIGALIVGAFGAESDLPNIDFNLICLLGIVVFVIVSKLVQWFKKIIKCNRK